MVHGNHVSEDDQVIPCLHHLPQLRRERSSGSFEQWHSRTVRSPIKMVEHVAAIAAWAGKGDAELRLVGEEKVDREAFRILEQQIRSRRTPN